MKLVPLFDRVVLKTVSCRGNKRNPVLFFRARQKREPQQAEVVAVGPGGRS